MTLDTSMVKLLKYFLAATIVGITHSAEDVPLSTPLECARLCHENEPPKTCYYHFVLESYMTLGKACQTCTPNSTNTFTAACQCVLANGVERAISTVNRMVPGPSIQVCLGDKVVVDVDNHIDGAEATIHWHGVFQHGSQYYDGAPYITQCPIHKGNSFRYQWIAGNSGTHFYHSHTGFHRTDGIFGSLIIRKPPSQDPSSNHYDEDLIEHVIVVNEWMWKLSTEKFPGRTSFDLGQTSEDILINGKGQTINPWTGCLTKTKLEVFTVQAGKRYRFRMINALVGVCPIQFGIEGHRLTLVATDGVAVKPVHIDSIISFTGERYDFVIDAKQSPKTYWIQIRALGECGERKVQQLAILKYQGAHDKPLTARPTYNKGLPQGVILNPLRSTCDENTKDSYCINQLVNAEEVDSTICDKASLTFDAVAGINEYPPQDLFEKDQYKKYLVVPTGFPIFSTINNYAWTYPPSPFISQFDDIDRKLFCNATTKPESCSEESCSCYHVIEVPAKKTAQIVLWDRIGNQNISHPFHMHGYAPIVVSMGQAPDANVEEYVRKHVSELDSQEFQERCRRQPPAAKDTVQVPQNGFVVLRFVANNPGFWLFHCHVFSHINFGMGMVVHVQGELPAVPQGFPKCGDFKAPVNSDFGKIEL